MSENNSERCVVISTDGHCGADLWDYKPYLESQYQDEFDEWARAYHDPWADFDVEHEANSRMGMASFTAPMSWESDERLKLDDEQGIAAEILFPNTTPPFFPSGLISAVGPRSAKEYEYRFAGVRAHNRWLVDYCSQAPGRRGGIAQLFLNNIDDAIAEVRYAKENGLMGVLLPADHILQLVNLYSPDLDSLWRTCAELDMAVHRHTGPFGEAESEGGPAAPWIGRLEVDFHAIRTIAHVICAGVFERYPSLKFVVAEIGASAGIPAFLDNLDQMYDRERSGKNSDSRITAAVAAMKKKPSEYFASNCFVGGPMDVRASYDAGTPNLMFGADIPHSEGTAPFTTKAIRLSLAGLPDEDITDILSRNAIRAYGFDLPFLQKVADRVGPTMAEIKSPLGLEEYPNYPAETRHPIFNAA